MHKPLITIGLTTFNAEDTLDSALNSIFSQTWHPMEIVAVDDCSTDQTLKILTSYTDRHCDLRVFSNSRNSGVAVSRNRIIEEATGEFIVFFDDDDYSLPDRIRLQYERITEYERKYSSAELVVCHSARLVVYPDDTHKLEPTMGQETSSHAPQGIAVAQRILIGTPLKDGQGACPTCSQMARLSTYRRVGGFDPALRRSEDTDFNIRLALAGGHFVGVGEPLVIQKMTKSSEKSLAEEYKNMRFLLEKYRNFIEQYGQFDFCSKWLEMKFCWMERKYSLFLRKLLILGMRHPSLTVSRFIQALPNLKLNRAFSRFHLANDGKTS